VVLPASHGVSRVPWYSGSSLGFVKLLSTRLLLPMVELSSSLRLAFSLPFIESPQPPFSRQYTVYGLQLLLLPVYCALMTEWVWALPSSLAATGGIDYSFSSSGYLDVSVPQVSSSTPILFSIGLRDITPAGLPHSGIYGSIACLRLTVAFRSLPRPSSPLSA
jgi:hypothetical protein